LDIKQNVFKEREYKKKHVGDSAENTDKFDLSLAGILDV
jgi:hypothetical protein